ncbi:hypothetical protein [Fodinicurvata halophila]
MSQVGPGGLFLTAGSFALMLASFTVYRIRMKAPVPADERENFVYMEPQTSAAVFELDPRSDYTGDSTGAGTVSGAEDRERHDHTSDDPQGYGAVAASGQALTATAEDQPQVKAPSLGDDLSGEDPDQPDSPPSEGDPVLKV